MESWRTSNFYRNWRHQSHECGTPFSPEPTEHCVNCLCRFCGKTVYSNSHFNICAARRTFCYKCRHFGHYARMCKFHSQEKGTSKKVKSKSKQKRDSQRMKEFKERKSMSEFPCFSLNNIELQEFCPVFDYRQEEIEKLKDEIDALNSEVLLHLTRGNDFCKKFKESQNENSVLKAEISLIRHDHKQEIGKLTVKIEDLGARADRMYDQRCDAIDKQFQLNREKEKLQETVHKLQDQLDNFRTKVNEQNYSGMSGHRNQYNRHSRNHQQRNYRR